MDGMEGEIDEQARSDRSARGSVCPVVPVKRPEVLSEVAGKHYTFVTHPPACVAWLGPSGPGFSFSRSIFVPRFRSRGRGGFMWSFIQPTLDRLGDDSILRAPAVTTNRPRRLISLVTSRLGGFGFCPRPSGVSSSTRESKATHRRSSAVIKGPSSAIGLPSPAVWVGRDSRPRSAGSCKCGNLA